MDTQREKEIGLGPKYPFEPLQAGECILSSGLLKYSNVGVGIGDTIHLQIKLYQLVANMAIQFNTYYKDPGLPDVLIPPNFKSDIPCVVKGIMTETYGKYEDDAQKNQITMEYNELFPYVLDYLDPTTTSIWLER